MLELIDHLEFLLMESLAFSNLSKRDPRELCSIAPCLIARDLPAIALARVPVSPPGIMVAAITRPSTVPVTSSVIFIISFMMMRSFVAAAAIALAALVALIIF